MCFAVLCSVPRVCSSDSETLMPLCIGSCVVVTVGLMTLKGHEHPSDDQSGVPVLSYLFKVIEEKKGKGVHIGAFLPV